MRVPCGRWTHDRCSISIAAASEHAASSWSASAGTGRGKTTLARMIPGAQLVSTDEFWNGEEFEHQRLRREASARCRRGGSPVSRPTTGRRARPGRCATSSRRGSWWWRGSAPSTARCVKRTRCASGSRRPTTSASARGRPRRRECAQPPGSTSGCRRKIGIVERDDPVSCAPSRGRRHDAPR